jgi:hypothetical protein
MLAQYGSSYDPWSMKPGAQSARLRTSRSAHSRALLAVLVPGLCRPERIGFDNGVNLIRTGQDLPHGVRPRHLLDDVSLSQALLTIDKEAFHAAVGVRYVDFVAHAERLAVNLALH